MFKLHVTSCMLHTAIIFFKKHKYSFLLWIFILAYIAYFSLFSILRYKTLYASYFDLGIMQQTVYNTYTAIKTGDLSRVLELTNPFGQNQIKRMAIHNDPLLALLAPFYFISTSPATLLIIQTIIIAFGAIAVFKIGQHILKNSSMSLLFSFLYLLYFPLQRANQFDFHAVTLSTTLLLFMFFLWLTKRYGLSLIFFILSLAAKEQVSLTTMFFGFYVLKSIFAKRGKKFSKSSNSQSLYFSYIVIAVSLIWFILSMVYIIPLFRGGNHFALKYYSDYGNSPIEIIIGMIREPYTIIKMVLDARRIEYFLNILGPLGFTSLLSPLELIMAIPEFAINILSSSGNMRNLFYHYSSVITPFVFISSIYGVNKIINVKYQKSKILGSFLIVMSLFYAYTKGPLPFAKNQNIHPFKYPQKEMKDVMLWSRTLKNESVKISSTGQLSPFFTARRYFYTFSANYYLADYAIVRLNEIYNYPEKNQLIPVYERLRRDKNYELIYKRDNFEVYKKVASS